MVRENGVFQFITYYIARVSVFLYLLLVCLLYYMFSLCLPECWSLVGIL